MCSRNLRPVYYLESALLIDAPQPLLGCFSYVVSVFPCLSGAEAIIKDVNATLIGVCTQMICDVNATCAGTSVRSKMSVNASYTNISLKPEAVTNYICESKTAAMKETKRIGHQN